MKTVQTALKTHLASTTTTLCTCWKITRTDGVVLGFTNNVIDITYPVATPNTLYEAATGFTPSAVESSSGLAVDNLDVEALLNSIRITEVDLMAGLYDFATVEIFQLNYKDITPTMGAINLRKGKIGEVKMGRHVFVAEIRGLMQALTKNIGELYSVTCRADLGDARCGVTMGSYTYSAAITTIVSTTNITAVALIGLADNLLRFGLITWTSGLNNTFKMEVDASVNTTGSVTLKLPMPYAMSVGDTFTITRGCDKAFSTCGPSGFNNAANFRGEPHIPGLDKMLKSGGS